MIRYPVTDIEAMIDAADSNWRAVAARRTAKFVKAARYFEPPKGNWGDIKDVYRALQYHKCAYCERRLPGEPFGSGDHAVEHYRPKGAVKAWPTPKIAKERGLNYDFELGDDWDEGYYQLAYAPWNYATVCNLCNSRLKGSYFPIMGKARGPQTDDPRKLRHEKPLLIYPIGDLDNNPEDLITFEGCIPVPTARTKKSYKYRRARVTIDFFGLALRDELVFDRLQAIIHLWAILKKLKKGKSAPEKREGEEEVEIAVADGSLQANCARSYRDLYRRNRRRAEAWRKVAIKVLKQMIIKPKI
jgi:hypothetical protein